LKLRMNYGAKIGSYYDKRGKVFRLVVFSDATLFPEKDQTPISLFMLLRSSKIGAPQH